MDLNRLTQKCQEALHDAQSRAVRKILGTQYLSPTIACPN